MITLCLSFNFTKPKKKLTECLILYEHDEL